MDEVTDRERVLEDGLRSVGKSIDAYLAWLRREDTIAPLGSVFVLLGAIREDVQRALEEAGS